MVDRDLHKSANVLEAAALDAEVHPLDGGAFLAAVDRPGSRMARRPVLRAAAAAVAFEQGLGSTVTTEGLSCGLRIAGMVLRSYPWTEAELQALDSHLTGSVAQG